jgi:hypothetical protein
VLVRATLTEGETLRMPEIGFALPMAEFYAGVGFSDDLIT